MRVLEKTLWVLFVIMLLVLTDRLLDERMQTETLHTEKSSESCISDITEKQMHLEELPEAYDARMEGKKPSVKDQKGLGTCWALAASSALEASLLPQESLVFSADHLSMQNHFAKSQNDGGDYTMVMAYLAGWQGPVLEKDDVYGDGISNDTLLPVKHVQEIQMLKNKDYETIKRAVMEHGAVQSSIYMDLKNAFSSSIYYNQLEYSYYYDGTEKSNHDVLIIGWDDQYDPSRFNRNTAGKGAFICQNSWGEAFGENGIFYVSYDDVNIGNNAIVYTVVENIDNYDHLYQTDLCGWVGQIGYGDGTCWFSNVYTSKGAQNLEAVGFYALGKACEYEVYVIQDFEDFSSFQKNDPVISGTLPEIGYYTKKLSQSIPLQENERFAVVVRIMTPGAVYPVAAEYVADEATAMVTLEDGEGYISHNGLIWSSTEKEYSCNICLKAYTKNR